jgi:hypothetical protein
MVYSRTYKFYILKTQEGRWWASQNTTLPKIPKFQEKIFFLSFFFSTICRDFLGISSTLNAYKNKNKSYNLRFRIYVRSNYDIYQIHIEDI